MFVRGFVFLLLSPVNSVAMSCYVVGLLHVVGTMIVFFVHGVISTSGSLMDVLMLTWHDNSVEF